MGLINVQLNDGDAENNFFTRKFPVIEWKADMTLWQKVFNLTVSWTYEEKAFDTIQIFNEITTSWIFCFGYKEGGQNNSRGSIISGHSTGVAGIM